MQIDEMINLDEMGSLKSSMETLQETLLNNHRIDPNLYIEYDVEKRTARFSRQGCSYRTYGNFRCKRL